ncbi:hypothetical protein Xbed_02039 [Xenorhabdus beddingii]|uniref:Virulence associated protein VapA n=1 Tax=Xenorhabdus beddingii TaxID=40578 RepID=A0A1Y2SL95_9GAMM|nr:VapA/VapB family virulence-associated protein [Xenorhabdus beddingii]OTA19731.1 hypothetical protein Xbed_02039 [Xenorhabdus beddingii]
MKVQNSSIDSELINVFKNDINSKFFRDMKGKKIDPVLLDGPAEKILLTTQKEKVDASVTMISEVIYFRLNVTAESTGRTFNGQGWSLSSVGAGRFSGGLYSDDLTLLYIKAHKFWFYEFLTLIFVTFYDKESQYLGTFRGNGLSTVNGVGSGAGIFY